MLQRQTFNALAEVNVVCVWHRPLIDWLTGDSVGEKGEIIPDLIQTSVKNHFVHLPWLVSACLCMLGLSSLLSATRGAACDLYSSFFPPPENGGDCWPQRFASSFSNFLYLTPKCCEPYYVPEVDTDPHTARVAQVCVPVCVCVPVSWVLLNQSM